MTQLTDEQLEMIAERLEGQCTVDLATALEGIGLDESAIDEELCAQVDTKVFLCEGCGWWASADELNNETDRELCDECAET